jgi:hypothetical protein
MFQKYVILPTLMVDTIGCELSRFAVLNDPAYNEIEVLVEKIGDSVCFSQGWLELNGMYDLKYGGSVTLVNVQPSRFVIQVKDRYGEEINYPHHVPPMSLRLNHDLFPLTRGFVYNAKPINPYRHDRNNFLISFSKWLDVDEAANGYLVCSIKY